MTLQYLTNEQGQKVAVVVPLQDWEVLRIKNFEYADDVPEELIAEAEKAWEEHQKDPGKAQTIEEVRKELLDDRED